MDCWNNKKAKSCFVSNVFGAAICIGLIATSGHTQSRYILSEQVFDFGYVGIDYKIFHNYKLINTSPKPIKIDSVDVLCDCSSLSYDKKVLGPNDTLIMKLTFDTKDFYGPVNRKFIVFLSLPEKETVSFFYLAEVGQWKNGLKPNPLAIFMLPTHTEKSLQITNKIFEYMKAEIQDQQDDFFTVKFLKEDAKIGEVLEISAIADKSLAKGTYLSNFTLKITADDNEPAFLTIPVKIARF